MQGTRPEETWAGGWSRKQAVLSSKGGASLSAADRLHNPPAVEGDMPDCAGEAYQK